MEMEMEMLMALSENTFKNYRKNFFFFSSKIFFQYNPLKSSLIHCHSMKSFH